MSKHICIVAGDMSGDEHAAAVVAALKTADPGVTISALGGARLQGVVDKFLGNIVDLNAFGFFSPFTLFFTLRRLFKNVLLASWDITKPDAVMLVDYYGFNIHVARAAHARGIDVYYYVSPQVWASRPHRIGQLKKYVTRMLVILPFEKVLYEAHGVPVTFVGHPLVDRIPRTDNFSLHPPVIGLFAGSRRTYFNRHLPILRETMRLISQEIPEASFVFFVVPSLRSQSQSLPFKVVSEDPGFIERRKITMAITTSGTVSLENTLLGIPMIVMYRLSWFNYILARILVNIKYIAMANILAGREIVPEFIQARATPASIARAAVDLVRNDSALMAMREQLLDIGRQLGQSGVASRVANVLLENPL
ncbi:MAG: lipid-A-disaccharide synthase [Endomicrobiales bacterium]